MAKALLVIDMQNICVGKDSAPFFQYDKEKLLADVNLAIANNSNNLVVYIKNIMPDNFLNRHFAPFKAFDNTPATELVDGLKVVSDHIVKKYKGDAFTNPDLLKLLQDNHITEVELVGVDGGGCVALTALGSVKHGFKVILNTVAIGTTPLLPRNSRSILNNYKNQAHNLSRP